MVRFDKSNIQSAAQVLTDIRQYRRDYLANANSLQIDENGRLSLKAVPKVFRVGRVDALTFEDAEWYLDQVQQQKQKDETATRIEVVEGSPALEISDKARAQLLRRLDVPVRYFHKQTTKGHLTEMYRHISSLLQNTTQQRFLVRTLHNKVRAVLSDSYKIADSVEVFFHALTQLKKFDAELWEVKLTPDADFFQLYAVAPGISESVNTERNFKGNVRWKPGPNDPHHPGVSICNSDCGSGARSTSLCVLRMICANFLVWDNAIVRLTHSGKKLATDDQSGLIMSQETRLLEAELENAKMSDLIATAFSPEKLKELVEKLNKATAHNLEDAPPMELVQAVAGHIGLPQSQEEALLKEFLISHDPTRYGLIQAVTAQAHALYATNPELAAACESHGGYLANVQESEFDRYLKAGKAKRDSAEEMYEAYATAGEEV